MSEPFDTRDDDLLVTEEGETLSDFDGSPERSTPEHDPLLAAVAVPEGAEPGDEVTEQHVASHVDDVDVDSEMRVVDEDAYADDDEQDDEEDYGHLARLFDEEEETPDAAASTALETASDPEIPLDLIDPEALWVVKRLRAKGYEAYLTGGCVRDLLLGIAPKDFDVATAAHPNQVKAVFRNCRLIGRRFRLAHVYFPDGKVIETATFRANPLDEMEDLPEDLLVERDNVFGTVEDDARRRDLTINGLFYDPIAGRVLDFVDGRRDLELRLIRTIGDPQIRFQEDPVRIMRAIKFATRLGFDFESETRQAMMDHVGELLRCAPPRLQEELLRLLTSKHGQRAFDLCMEFGLIQTLLPELIDGLSRPLAAATALRTTEPAAPGGGEAGLEAGPDVAAGPSDDAATAVVPGVPVPRGDADHADVVTAQPGLVEVVQEERGEAAEMTATEAAPADAAVELPDTSLPEGAGLAVALLPPSSEQRFARLDALLAAIDEVRRRDAEVSSAVVWAAVLLPIWEAMEHADIDRMRWFEQALDRWTERVRFTRRDKDTLWLLLRGLEQLEPRGRRGNAARHMVTRPWFKETLLLFTLSKYAAGESLDDVGRWKAIAQHHQQSYRQPRAGERAPRPQGRGDRDMKRGRRSRRGGGGGGGGGRRGGRRRG